MTLHAHYIKILQEQHGLSPGEAKYIADKISNAIRNCGDENITHTRISVDGKGMNKYRAIQRSGCCASHEEAINLKSGRIVLFGFNYNH